MDILSVSALRVLHVSHNWSACDITKWTIFTIAFIIMLCSACILISDVSKHAQFIHPSIGSTLLISFIVCILSCVINVIPQPTNVNSDSYFNHLYITRVRYAPSSTHYIEHSYTPSTIAYDYNHIHFTMSNIKKLLHTDKILSKKSIYKKHYYKQQINYNTRKLEKLNTKLVKYKAYLDTIPASDVENPVWWQWL